MFDDIKAIMKAKKELGGIVTELFVRCKKRNFTLVFISQSYFKAPKTIRLKATHYFIMKIPNKIGLQQITSNQLCDIDF